ncbi:MAG: sodium:solute symporter family protein, partial [Rickettsiales bacterium]
MQFDISIISLFLIINLVAGVYSGRGIKTIKEYAIGDRNFGTATIAATIIATWISGSFFTVCISQTYKEGVWFLPAALGDVLSLIIIGYVFAPRMKEFFGSLSVAETMGNLYGRNVRLIT